MRRRGRPVTLYRSRLREAALGTVSAQPLDGYDPLGDLATLAALAARAWLDRPCSRFVADPEDVPTSEHLILPTHWPSRDGGRD